MGGPNVPDWDETIEKSTSIKHEYGGGGNVHQSNIIVFFTKLNTIYNLVVNLA